MGDPESTLLQDYIAALPDINIWRWTGRVREVVGLLVTSDGPSAGVGDFCEIHASGSNACGGSRVIRAQVVGFRDGRVLLMPLDETGGLQAGDAVVARPGEARVQVGPGLLGRVLDGFGKPMDGKGPIAAEGTRDLYATPPGPLERAHITEALVTGVRAIDSLLPFGKGQRIGIFGGSGVGNFGSGSITAFFTVLVEGDDFNEPIADAVRAILDGHVVLSRELGARGHFPAIDVLNSVSRLAGKVASKDQREAARKVREALAAYRQSEDLINLGAYAAGSNAQLDSAIKLQPRLSEFLRQEPDVNEPIEKTLQQFYALAGLTKS